MNRQDNGLQRKRDKEIDSIKLLTSLKILESLKVIALKKNNIHESTCICLVNIFKTFGLLYLKMTIFKNSTGKKIPKEKPFP